MNYFETVDRIEKLYNEGNISQALDESRNLGNSLREAVKRGEMTFEQAGAIIDTIGINISK